MLNDSDLDAFNDIHHGGHLNHHVNKSIQAKAMKALLGMLGVFFRTLLALMSTLWKLTKCFYDIVSIFKEIIDNICSKVCNQLEEYITFFNDIQN